jgi:NADH:ubiquinone oxidoreductase subunit 6 (subunit J)
MEHSGIKFKIFNVFHSMPYLITLFFICIGVIWALAGATGINYNTPITTAVAVLVFTAIILIDTYMLDKSGKDKSAITPTTVVLFIALFILLSIPALLYIAYKEIFQSDKKKILPEIEKKYPEKVDAIVRELNPKSYSCV